MNLRTDDTFVQDKGWYRARERYRDFLRRQEGRRVIFLELGVGYNTPGIIKYPFWKMTAQNPEAAYACLNSAPDMVPEELRGRAVCVWGDIGEALEVLAGRR